MRRKIITCEVCKEKIPENVRRYRGKFCSKKCSNRNSYDNRDVNNTLKGISPIIIGNIHEMVVCTDLMLKGFTVFRNIAQLGCDLVILDKYNKLFRVEVTTGTLIKDKLYWPTKNSSNFDILAVVRNGKEITYFPAYPWA